MNPTENNAQTVERVTLKTTEPRRLLEGTTASPVMLLPTGMVTVLNGTIDDGYGGMLGWFWLACAVTTIVLVFDMFLTLIVVCTFPLTFFVTGCKIRMLASPLIGGTILRPASTGVSCVD